MYPLLRSIPFTEVARSMQLLPFLNDEKKIKKYASKFSEFVEISATTKKKTPQFELNTLISVLPFYLHYPELGSNEFWKSVETIISNQLSQGFGSARYRCDPDEIQILARMCQQHYMTNDRIWSSII